MKQYGRLGKNWPICSGLIIVHLLNDLFASSYLNFFLDSFVCDGCLKKTNKTRKENKYCAKSKSQSFLWFQNINQNVIQKASEHLLNTSCLAFSHRVATDKVGLFPGDESEWLPEASKPSRVWRRDYSRCSCLWQSSRGETGNEIEVWGWKMLLGVIHHIESIVGITGCECLVFRHQTMFF